MFIESRYHSYWSYQFYLSNGRPYALFQKLRERNHDMLSSSPVRMERPFVIAEEYVASAILDIVFRHRNLLPGSMGGSVLDREPHLEKIRAYIHRGEAIQLVLPAFPAKSPNPEKTTGVLPDLGEVLALRFLNALCEDIARVYSPGARIVICSDGRVFSDLVKVTDENVDAYAAGIRAILAEHGLVNLSTYNLEDVFGHLSYDAMRAALVDQFASPVESIRERVRSREEDRQLFNGIHRFIFEDRAVLEEGSRNSIRERSKAIAYAVIQRSNAWSALVERQFPRALRLSIHPQAAGCPKIGVKLLPGNDIWGTPWHGVVLADGASVRLVKRKEAEAAGATLTLAEGRYGFYSFVPEGGAT